MRQSKYHFDHSVFRTPMTCGGRRVYQIGEMYFEGAGVIEPHVQRCDELSFIISGRGRFIAGDEQFAVQAGDLIYSYTGEAHRIESNPRAPLRFYYIGFDTDERDEAMLRPIREVGHRAHCPQAEPLFSAIIDETYNRRDFSSDMIGASLQTMLITLARTCLRTPPPAAAGSSLVYQIVSFLSAHIDSPDTLSRLEEEFHYSYGFLFRHFSAVMGQSLRDCFQTLRMERARAMLCDGKTVTETACALGYSSVHPFSRAYKKHFGASPTHRKQDVL